MPVLNDADDLKLGSSQVDKVYLGANLVWEPAAAGVPLELISANAVYVNASSVSLPIPATAQAGDLLVISGGHAWAISLPSGWIDRDHNTGGSNVNGRTFTRICQAGDPGTNVTVSFSGSYAGVWSIFVVRGGAWRGITTDWASSHAAATAYTIPGATAVAGDLALYQAHFRASSGTITLGHGTADDSASGSNASGGNGHETVTTSPWGQTVSCSVAGSGRYLSNIIIGPESDMPGEGGPLRGTPTITFVNNANTVNATLPSGVQAGDFLVMAAAHGNNPNLPTGWTNADYQTGIGCGGRVAYKVADSTDVTNGYITVTFTGTYYGEVALIAFQGATGGIREVASLRSSSGSTSVTVTTAGSAAATDTAIYFGFTRRAPGGSTYFSRGVTHAQRVTDANAAAGVATEGIESSGVVSCTITHNGIGTAYYDAVILVQAA